MVCTLYMHRAYSLRLPASGCLIPGARCSATPWFSRVNVTTCYNQSNPESQLCCVMLGARGRGPGRPGLVWFPDQLTHVGDMCIPTGLYLESCTLVQDGATQHPVQDGATCTVNRGPCIRCKVVQPVPCILCHARGARWCNAAPGARWCNAATRCRMVQRCSGATRCKVLGTRYTVQCRHLGYGPGYGARRRPGARGRRGTATRCRAPQTTCFEGFVAADPLFSRLRSARPPANPLFSRLKKF